MDYYLAGYYLVDGLPRPSQMASFLPAMLWSISSCLCAIYPDTWALSWVTQTPVDRSAMQAHLGLDAEDFGTLQAQTDAAFEQQYFGWPNVWLERAAAEQFQRQYLAAFPQVKLLSLALPAAYLEDFLRSSTPAPGQGVAGPHQMLSRRIKVAGSAANASARGYEILGAEVGGSFHSFLCNYLEVPYQQQLQVRFNDYGLIADYADAVRAAEFTNLPTTGAEPVPWYPWVLIE
jgi:hypothetical protein